MIKITDLTIYGSDGEYTYFKHKDGYIVQLRIQANHWSKQINRYNSIGELTSVYYEPVEVV